jgi:hypothetical protein
LTILFDEKKPKFENLMTLYLKVVGSRSDKIIQIPPDPD